MNKCKATKIPPLLVNNQYVLNFKDKAQTFAKYFADQCKPILNDSSLPTFTNSTDKRLDTILLRDEEILKLIRNLNPSKSAGADGISAQMLLICDSTILSPLKLIFSNIISTGIYPDMWKIANVTPIHKKDKKYIINNYRPISLLPICSKIFEKIIHNQLYNFLTSNNLITKNQSGFRPGDSTVNQLIDLVNDIGKSFDDPKSLETRAVFLDISKAFDKVWHTGLIFKLKQNGISGSLILLLENYLSNRKHKVVLNGFSSDLFSVEAGVPQGSVLGPLLFLIYINDLEINIKSKIKFFADDTMLFSIVKNPLNTAVELNHDLDLISKWAFQWKMSFNPEATKQAVEVLFSLKTSKPNHPDLFFNNNKVSKVNEHKHLGLTLDSKLLFVKHINEKIKLARKGIGVIKRVSKYLPVKILTQLYKTYVRPHFDYCDIIYHTPHIVNVFDHSISLNTSMERIERVQYQAALSVTGTWQGTNRNRLYDELGWESLNYRRWFRRLVLFYKIHNGQSPEYLNNNLPSLRRLIYGANNNNNNIYTPIKCRTTKYMNSFFPDTVKSWNGIVLSFQSNLPINQFKRNILSLIRPLPRSTFGIHDYGGLKFIYQLRVRLSQLKCHKYNHNFTDTISDWCDCHCAPEDIPHFLFKCPFYTVPRSKLIPRVSNILTEHLLNHLQENSDLYLYGHSSLNNTTNASILKFTIEYIKETNRFT